MAVDAKKVKKLRELTGLPMMECKRALEATDGDVEKAHDELRKAGAKAQEKLAGRTAVEGRVASAMSADGKVGAVACVRCETEPVANNEMFVAFAEELVQVVLDQNPADADTLLATTLPSGGTVSEGVTGLVNQLRENISVGAFKRLEADAVCQYVHFDNKKSGIVALSGNSASDEGVAPLGKDLCMHIVFSKPACLSRDQIDSALVEKEREIRLAAAQNDPKNAKKPAEILGKIVEGQINKFIAERCFLEQVYIRAESNETVEKAVAASGTGTKIEDYAYVATDA